MVKKIYLFHDTPHLIKSVRNNLKHYNFKLFDKLIKWEYLEKLYFIDKDMNPRLCPKVKLNHLNLPPFTPMRVCLATQLLSHSVGKAMATLIKFKQLPEEAQPTADFILFMDKAFDCFNSSSFQTSKALNRPLSENSTHWNFFNEIEKNI